MPSLEIKWPRISELPMGFSTDVGITNVCGKRHHDSICRSAARLNYLVNNLLDVARIDSNQKIW